MSRLFNFSAGPAMLPEPVLKRAQSELVDWQGSGMSVMEMSHRGKEFMSIANKTESDLRRLLVIPDNYKVLFLQGGASSQFAMVPMNLASADDAVDYINTGAWSKKAIAEAKRYCNVNVIWTGENNNFSTTPEESELNFDNKAAYVHYTPNETIGGVEFPYIPDTGDIPLVADMSSTILSRPLDVSRFGIIYAGAQKNIGPAGLTLVIIRDDLLGSAQDATPSMFKYQIHADNDSMYNTPPTFGIYLAGLVFEWLLEKGGLPAMAEINKRKAELLYQCIDDSSYYHSPVEPRSRSWMNVPFTLTNADKDAEFLEQAAAIGLTTLKGHRSVGGMRASIYNAMPEAGVEALVSFMQSFSKN